MVNFGFDVGLSLTTERTAAISDIHTYKYSEGYGVHLLSSVSGPLGLMHFSSRHDMTIKEADALRLKCQKKVEYAKRRMRDKELLPGLFREPKWDVA